MTAIRTSTLQKEVFGFVTSTWTWSNPEKIMNAQEILGRLSNQLEQVTRFNRKRKKQRIKPIYLRKFQKSSKD